MNYILVGRNGRPSIRATHLKMSMPCCVLMKKYDSRNAATFWWYKHDKSTDSWVKTTYRNANPSFDIGDIVIRWGFSGAINGHPHIIQHGRAIDTISNKYRSRIAMANSGVPVPRTYNYNEIAHIATTTLIERPHYHSQGKQFGVILPRQSVVPKVNHYYSELYNKQQELRAHVAHGNVLILQDKNIDTSSDCIQGNRHITHAQWRVLRWGEYPSDVCAVARHAVQAVGAHMGGVDLMVDRNNENMPVCVCEINAAPTIKSSEYAVSRYAKYFDWVFRNPHHEQFQHDNYVWTNMLLAQ